MGTARGIARTFVTLALLGLVPAWLAGQATANPHGEIKTPCSACHAAEGWTPVKISAEFNHARSGFALSGAHAKANCKACHATLDFQNVPTACTSCHRDVHHGELGTNCGACHTSRSFLDQTAMVRAHQQTRFQLTGAHIATDCRLCHQPTPQSELRFANLSTNCADCHIAAYRGATSPNHVTAGLPLNCEACHATTVWQDARFNHSQTGFALSGEHAAIACGRCHLNNSFTGTSTACVSCHQKDFNATTSMPGVPNHVAIPFQATCQDCHHGTETWVGAVYNHSGTQFPLNGAHLAVSCTDARCHGDGVYSGKPSTCISCHQNDYNTPVLSHVAAGFSTDCAQSGCHNTTTFTGVKYVHTAAQIPFSGNHLYPPRTCTDCHSDGVYQGKPSTCISCHTADYNTPKLSHTGAGFPTTCLNCHTSTTSWATNWKHSTVSTFPTSGNHAAPCATCHNVSSDFGQFTCLTCHEHSQSSMDSKHSGRSGYSYNSQACLTCHPTGKGG